MKTHALSAVAAAAATIALLAGCAAAAAPATPPPFGATALATPAKKYIIATVGDSHAVRFSQGMEQVAGGAYQIVNGAFGGCGIMRESQYKLSTIGLDKVNEANRACDDWDVKWGRLVEQSNPDAVLLTTSYWDVNAQRIDDTDRFLRMTDKQFRDQYAASLMKGIDILAARGARVYLDNSLPYLGTDLPSAEAMSATVTEVYQKAKAAGKNVGLLDLRGQLCTGTTCPSSIDGVPVMDETSHPAGESLARQSRWILNTISADLTAEPQ